MTKQSLQRRYRVLGPLEVEVGGRALTLHGKQRDLLGILLLRPGDVVSTDELIDELWGDAPPPTAANTLQVHVSRLRRLLEPGVLVSRPPGYVLEIAPGELDSSAFEELVAQA